MQKIRRRQDQREDAPQIPVSLAAQGSGGGRHRGPFAGPESPCRRSRPRHRTCLRMTGGQLPPDVDAEEE